MPKGYIMVSYLELPTEENLSNYAPKAMEAIKNAGGKFIARGMPVATYENGMNQRREPCRQGCIAISDTWSDASVVQTRVMQVQKGVYNPAGHDVFLACLRV